jgi:hypothetical protein
MLNRFLQELVRHFGRGRGEAPPGAAAGTVGGKLGDPVGGELSYEALFRAHDGRLVDKWSHYFEIYGPSLREGG